ncbi:unknown protein [Seminavis robusta]|uniref:Uncharacterized protein n=1 Tax=Seminavis robusta TaxID=568900 RepID=A0A9N8F430_9STRA|nr:unknown protein [Seminavis robusta]|eukprot:Sro2788_g337120.1 n/a (253) ;mRNA; r:6792-7550
MNRDGTVNTDLDPMADYLLQIEASNKMHCASLNMFGFDGDRLLLTLTRRKAERYTEITKPNTVERQAAIAKNLGTAGQLYHQTHGQHLTSDDFFRGNAMRERTEQVDKLEKKKKIELAKMALKEQRDAIIQEKGEPTAATISAFNAKEMGILYKYKKGSAPKGKKAEVLLAYLAAPAPRKLDGWSAEEEAELQRLKTQEIPLEDTQVAIAADQSANAVINHAALLSVDKRVLLINNLRNSFDHDEVSQQRAM